MERKMGGGDSGPITFTVEDYDGVVTSYTIPHPMTWGEFINSEYNVEVKDPWTGALHKEFAVSVETDGTLYVSYRDSLDDPSLHVMLHLWDWEYINIDEQIKAINYTSA